MERSALSRVRQKVVPGAAVIVAGIWFNAINIMIKRTNYVRLLLVVIAVTSLGVAIPFLLYTRDSIKLRYLESKLPPSIATYRLVGEGREMVTAFGTPWSWFEIRGLYTIADGDWLQWSVSWAGQNTIAEKPECPHRSWMYPEDPTKWKPQRHIGVNGFRLTLTAGFWVLVVVSMHVCGRIFRRRKAGNFCPVCEYSLEGVQTQKCPECGTLKTVMKRK